MPLCVIYVPQTIIFILWILMNYKKVWSFLINLYDMTEIGFVVLNFYILRASLKRKSRRVNA